MAIDSYNSYHRHYSHYSCYSSAPRKGGGLLFPSGFLGAGLRHCSRVSNETRGKSCAYLSTSDKDLLFRLCCYLFIWCCCWLLFCLFCVYLFVWLCVLFVFVWKVTRNMLRVEGLGFRAWLCFACCLPTRPPTGVLLLLSSLLLSLLWLLLLLLLLLLLVAVVAMVEVVVAVVVVVVAWLECSGSSRK